MQPCVLNLGISFRFSNECLIFIGCNKYGFMKRLCLILIITLACAATASAQSGVWSGKLDVQGTKLSLVFHLDDDPVVDSPDQGVKGIPVRVERAGAGKITVQIPSLGAVYEGVWMISRIVGTFTQMNVSLPLTLTPGEDKPSRPQTPEGPFPYSTEEVSFTNDGYVLNGTLTLPDGYTRSTPALVMVTGSGTQNRDEEIFEHKPFAVIADALARAGVVTLRYDDRGFGESSPAASGWTTEDFKKDALAGIGLLREKFDKVGVLGHSEGGTIAMMLAAEDQADFIISLAGMVVSGAETLVYQNRVALKGAGLPDEVIESYCRLLETAFDVRVNGGWMPDPDEYDLPEPLLQNYWAVVAQIQMPYMIYLLSLDMRSHLAAIDCPVLALNGTKDQQVEYGANLNALTEGLPPGERNIIMPVEGVNHLFQHCTTGAVTEYREIEETISQEVLDIIVNWLAS